MHTFTTGATAGAIAIVLGLAGTLPASAAEPDARDSLARSTAFAATETQPNTNSNDTSSTTTSGAPETAPNENSPNPHDESNDAPEVPSAGVPGAAAPDADSTTTPGTSPQDAPADPAAQSLSAGALQLTVTTGADDGPGSLREAVEQTNTHPGADSIMLAPGLDRISLSTPLTITDEVSIGAPRDPENPSNIFIDVEDWSVDSDAALIYVAQGGLELSNIELQVEGALSYGIYLGEKPNMNFASPAPTVAALPQLTLDGAWITNPREAGVQVVGNARAVTIRNSCFTHTEADNSAIGLSAQNSTATPFTVTNSTFTGFAGGAAVFEDFTGDTQVASPPPIVFERSKFAANGERPAGVGTDGHSFVPEVAGIRVSGFGAPYGQLQVHDSTFSSNHGSRVGAIGIFDTVNRAASTEPSAVVTGSVFADNTGGHADDLGKLMQMTLMRSAQDSAAPAAQNTLFDVSNSTFFRDAADAPARVLTVDSDSDRSTFNQVTVLNGRIDLRWVNSATVVQLRNTVIDSRSLPPVTRLNPSLADAADATTTPAVVSTHGAYLAGPDGTASSEIRGDGDIRVANPAAFKLSTLDYNGGETQSALPLEGSPLRKAGAPATEDDVDQRGVERTAGKPADIGATQVSIYSTSHSPGTGGGPGGGPSTGGGPKPGGTGTSTQPQLPAHPATPAHSAPKPIADTGSGAPAFAWGVAVLALCAGGALAFGATRRRALRSTASAHERN